MEWFTHAKFEFLGPPMAVLLFVDITIEIAMSLICEPDLLWVDLFGLNHLNHEVCELQSSLNIEGPQNLVHLNFVWE